LLEHHLIDLLDHFPKPAKTNNKDKAKVMPSGNATWQVSQKMENLGGYYQTSRADPLTAQVSKPHTHMQLTMHVCMHTNTHITRGVTKVTW
jgi:hypothetical protein